MQDKKELSKPEGEPVMNDSVYKWIASLVMKHQMDIEDWNLGPMSKRNYRAICRQIEQHNESLKNVAINLKRKFEESKPEPVIGERSPELLKQACIKFFYYWWNEPGNNTEQGFDQWLQTGEGQQIASQFKPKSTLQERISELETRLNRANDYLEREGKAISF